VVREALQPEPSSIQNHENGERDDRVFRDGVRPKQFPVLLFLFVLLQVALLFFFVHEPGPIHGLLMAFRGRCDSDLDHKIQVKAHDAQQGERHPPDVQP